MTQPFAHWSTLTRLLVGLLLLVLPLGGLACGGGDDDTPSPGITLKSITVSPATANVAVGATQQFAVNGVYSDGKTKAVTTGVTWTSSTTTVATINTSGLATAVANGSTTITATAGKLKGTATLTVITKALTGIQVTPASASIGVGTTQQYAATANYNDGTTTDVTASATWSSSETATATISATGLASGVAAGTSTISATFEAATGTAILTVTDNAMTGIVVAPATASIPAGATEAFTATAEYADGTTQDVTADVTWTSSDTEVATMDDETATGVAPGTATITAAHAASGMSGTAALTVTEAVVTSLQVTPATEDAIVGGPDVEFTATAIYSDGTSVDVTDTATWTSSDDTIATVAAGVATGIGAGVATITAEFGGEEATAELTVSVAVLDSIVVEPATDSIPVGTTLQYTATGNYNNGTTQDLTTTVDWVSSDTAVATITAGGLAAGVAAGTTTITATHNGVSGTAALTVTSVVLDSIQITPPNATIAAGTTQAYTALGTYSDGSVIDISGLVSWTSSATAVATITGGVATGVAPGTTTISATYQTITSNAATLLVINAVPTGVTVSCDPTSIVIGNTSQCTAMAAYSDGSSLNVTLNATWTTSSAAIASVTQAGLVAGVSAGAATITATFQTFSGSATVNVSAAVLQTIQVTPTNPSIPLGANQQFVATGLYNDGSTQVITTAVGWTSSAPAVATINAAGLATSVSAGPTTITASLSGITGSTTLTVTPATLESIEIAPTSALIAIGGTRAFTATGVYSDTSTVVLTNLVNWASSSTAVATITSAGLATGVANGTTNITATYQGVTSNTAVLAVSGKTLTGVAVSCTPTSIAAGTTSQCTATASFSDLSSENVTSSASWASSNNAFATVTQLGVVTGVAVGSPTITATYQTQSGSATVTVTAAFLESIAITPLAPSIALGNTQQFQAVGHYSNNTTQTITTQVTWASSAPARATISNAAGSHGLATSVSVGTTNITAALGPITSNTAVLSVTAATLTAIQVLPANPTVPAGFQQQFTARGVYSDTTTADLTADPLVSFSSGTTTVATISNAAATKGLASTLIAGTSVITATRGTLSGTTTLTVSNATLTSIAVTPGTQTSQVGSTVPYTATGTFSNNTTMNITTQAAWTVSPTGTGVTIGAATGIATIAANATPNQYTVRATLGAVFGNATLTVVQPLTLQSIQVRYRLSFGDFEINPFSYGWAMPENETLQAVAVGTYSDGLNPPVEQDITALVTWVSTNTTCFTMSNVLATKGLMTATANVPGGGGACYGEVYASLNAVDGINYMNVVDPTLCPESPNLMVLAPWAIPDGPGWRIYKGQETQSVALVEYGGACSWFAGAWEVTLSPNTTWTSSVPGVATVNSTGVVTASNNPASPYTSTITATHTRPGYTGTGNYLLTVTNACIQSISVSPQNPTLPRGLKQPLDVTAIYSDGSQEVYNYLNPGPLTIQQCGPWVTGPCTPSTAFTVGNAGIVEASQTVTGSGRVDVRVNAQACNAASPPTASTNITVNSATITGVTVAPASLSLAKGGTGELTATGTYSDNTQHNVDLIANWTTSAGTIATVGTTQADAGLVTASLANEGNAVISARVGTFTGSSAVTVSGCTIQSLTVNLGTGFTCGGAPYNPGTPPTGGQPYPVGINIPLAVTATYTGGCAPAPVTSQVTWQSSLGAISVANGFARTNGSTGGSVATITASIGSVSGNILLASSAQTLAANLTVTPASFLIPNAGTQQFNASGTFATAGACDLLGNVVNWSAAPGTLLTINANGRATGAATGSGSATVTATYAPDTSRTGTVAGTVGGTCVEALVIDSVPTNATIPEGSSVDFRARWRYGNGSYSAAIDTDVTWSIVSQAPAGTLGAPNANGVFAGLQPGTATIRAFRNYGPTCTSTTPVDFAVTAPVTVTESSLATITIHCDQNIVANQIPVNVRGACRAEGFDGNGQLIGDITQDLNWTAVGQASVNNTAGTKGAITAGASAGSAIIRVEMLGSSPLIFDEQTLQVLPGSALQSVGIAPATKTLPVGYGEQYVATGNYTGGLVFDLTNAVGIDWRCCTNNSATCVAASNCSITGSGFITPTSATPATVYPIVRLGTSSSTHATLNVSTQALTAITVNRLGTPLGAATNMVLGEEVQFRAMGMFGALGPYDITETVNWSTSIGGYIALSNAAGSKGYATATAITPSGTNIEIRANNVSPAVQGVYANPLAVINKCIDGVTLSANTTSAPSGLGVRFQVTASYSDNTSGTITQNPGILWDSDYTPALGNPTQCGGAAEGLPCIFYAGTPGQSSYITASIVGCGGVTFDDTLLVSVNNATLTGITVAPSSTNLPKGQTTQFTATANYSNNTSFDVTTDPVQTTWSSADTAVATVELPKGTARASTTNFGSTSIIANYYGATAFGTVNVVDEVLVDIRAYALQMIPSAGPSCPNFNTVPPTINTDWSDPWIQMGFQLPAGGYKSRVRAQGIYSDGTRRDITGSVTWTSSTGGVATVVGGLVETGATAGTTTLRAAVGTIGDDIILNTSASTLSAVNVVPDGGFTRPIGVSARFQMVGTFGATTYCITESASWSSASTAIATVSNADGIRGTVTGVAVGGTSITGTVGTLTNTEPFGVTSAVLQSITIAPAAVSMHFGETAQLVAMGHYSDSSSADITKETTTGWFTQGNYTAVGSGATSGGLVTAGGAAGTDWVWACVGGLGGICANAGPPEQRAAVTVQAP